MTSGRPADGFTLLEVLVALAILSLSLAAIYQAFGIGLRNDAQTHRYWAATILAESRLALIGTEVAADVGRWTGETPDGYRWAVEVVPAPDEPVPPARDRMRLLQVSVVVAWADGGRQRDVRLLSFRLGQPPAEGAP